MTKSNLIEAVSASTEKSKNDVEAVVNAVIEKIANALESGERVDHRGFGNFSVKERKARQGRNPKTGETIEIEARKAVGFKPSKELAERLSRSETVPTKSCCSRSAFLYSHTATLLAQRYRIVGMLSSRTRLKPISLNMRYAGRIFGHLIIVQQEQLTRLIQERLASVGEKQTAVVQ